MDRCNRWVLLEHVGDPDDVLGRHFDLLIEDSGSCRTWRLNTVPVVDGPPLDVVQLHPHKLHWLETTSKKRVSGGRGWAKPIKGGLFKGKLPVDNNCPFQLELQGPEFICLLKMTNNSCAFRSFSD